MATYIIFYQYWQTVKVNNSFVKQHISNSYEIETDKLTSQFINKETKYLENEYGQSANITGITKLDD